MRSQEGTSTRSWVSGRTDADAALRRPGTGPGAAEVGVGDDGSGLAEASTSNPGAGLAKPLSQQAHEGIRDGLGPARKCAHGEGQGVAHLCHVPRNLRSRDRPTAWTFSGLHQRSVPAGIRPHWAACQGRAGMSATAKLASHAETSAVCVAFFPCRRQTPATVSMKPILLPGSKKRGEIEWNPRRSHHACRILTRCPGFGDTGRSCGGCSPCRGHSRERAVCRRAHLRQPHIPLLSPGTFAPPPDSSPTAQTPWPPQGAQVRSPTAREMSHGRPTASSRHRG